MRRIRGNTGTRNIFFFQINQSTKVSSILRGNVGKLEKKCRNETPIQESTLIPFACFLQPPPLVASEDTSLFLTTETHPPTHPPIRLFLFRPPPLPPPLCSLCWMVTRLYSNPPPRADKRARRWYLRTHPPPLEGRRV